MLEQVVIDLVTAFLAAVVAIETEIDLTVLVLDYCQCWMIAVS